MSNASFSLERSEGLGDNRSRRLGEESTCHYESYPSEGCSLGRITVTALTIPCNSTLVEIMIIAYFLSLISSQVP
jgi:hypothetical protein